MTDQKTTAPAATEADKNIQKRIEKVSHAYLDFLESSLKSPESLNIEIIHALNDSIRILHHLKKMND